MARCVLAVAAGLSACASTGFCSEFDPGLDSLVTSGDGRHVSFKSMIDETWEGIEIRMPSRQQVTIDLSAGGRSDLKVQVGTHSDEMSFPVTLVPDQATVARNQQHRLFEQQDSDIVIFWIDPGSDPSATDSKQDELRRRLKAIGYIE